MPGYKPGYSLLFGTELFYYVLKMITTVYERLLKAKQLIQVQSIEQFQNENYADERF